MDSLRTGLVITFTLVVAVQMFTFGLILMALNSVRGEFRMSLADLQAKMAQLQADTAAEHTVDLQILADVQKLLAGASAGPGPGPGPGQVIVNESDLDALTQTTSDIDTQVVADTAAATAADATVNPPTTPPAGS